MITNIFLISRETGACIYHKSYENTEDQHDSTLISGYLTALSDISEEIGGQAQELRLQNKILKYKFVDKNTLLCFIIDAENDTPEKMKVNNAAVDNIIKKFKEVFPKSINFNGDLSEFHGRNQLDNQVFDKIIYETLFQNGELAIFFEERLEYLKSIINS